MANTNTDLTEEDASDLQFPKDSRPIFGGLSISDICGQCSRDLICPYISCAVCRVNLCSGCFAQGAEFGEHRNDHDYAIMRDDFVLFEGSDWCAKEEKILIEGLQKYGNFGIVARELPNRSLDEIKFHYDYFYLNKCSNDNLLIEKVVPYRLKINDSNEPPRYTSNTIGYQSLAGYNPARSDFECDFDSTAEDLLTNLKPIETDDSEYELLTDLQCAIVQSYNRRLLERQRRKKIIKDQGLIILRKVNAWLHRYDVTVTKPVYEKMIRFMQLLEPMEFEMIMEGLHRSGELKMQIMRFCELRLKGIRSVSDARLYLRLKKLHDECETDLKAFQTNNQLNWRNNNKNFSVDLSTKKRRSTFTPIEVIGMPGYEQLTPSERELCRTVRLVPILYLELKELLIAESKKLGSLKLKTARKMLKIDVNKTRRLFDFLVQEGYVVKATL